MIHMENISEAIHFTMLSVNYTADYMIEILKEFGKCQGSAVDYTK